MIGRFDTGTFFFGALLSCSAHVPVRDAPVNSRPQLLLMGFNAPSRRLRPTLAALP